MRSGISGMIRIRLNQPGGTLHERGIRGQRLPAAYSVFDSMNSRRICGTHIQPTRACSITSNSSSE